MLSRRLGCDGKLKLLFSWLAITNGGAQTGKEGTTSASEAVVLIFAIQARPGRYKVSRWKKECQLFLYHKAREHSFDI